MQQLEGIYIGYNSSVFHYGKAEWFLTFDEFYYLTNMGDLEDIINAFDRKNRTEMNCNSYVKLTPKDLICGHITFNNFSLMLRIYKVSYIF